MLQPWKSEQMVNEHLNTILKEAEVSRMASLSKRENFVYNSSLKHMVAAFGSAETQTRKATCYLVPRSLFHFPAGRPVELTANS